MHKSIKPVLAFTLIMIHSIGLFAHEEPAKTIKEKDKKEHDRIEILRNNIVSYTVWNHKFPEINQDFVLKEKFLTLTYDSKGNISEMQVYKSNDTLDYKVVLNTIKKTI